MLGGGVGIWPIVGDPELVLELVGMSVVLKPRGWEVDGKGSAGNDCELLSTFVQSTYPEETHPLVYYSEFDHGFIHRLDIPSSGLILTGTSFEGLYWIRWQLNVYHIGREYHVVCQDLVHAELETIDAPIDVRTHKLGSHRSLTGEHGGPALTWVRAVAHVLNLRPTVSSAFVSKSLDRERGGPSSVTPVIIRIRTGRKHQIRTHLLSSLHPSVADGMYAVSAILMTGLSMSLPL